MIVRGIGGGGGGASITGTPFDFVNINAGGTQGQDSGWSRDTDPALAANSDLRIPTQKAVKSYADNVGASALGWVNPVFYGASGSVVSTTGTVTHNSNIVTLASATSFANANGIALLGTGTTEDFTTYTEQDTLNYFTETATNTNFTAIPDNINNEFVYKDYGAGYFAGDFLHYGQCLITANSGATVAAIGIYCLANELGQYPGTPALQNCMDMSVQINTTNATLIMTEIHTGTANQTTATMGNRSGATLYWTSQKSGSTWTVNVYSDSARTTLIVSKSLTLAVPATSFRYAYGAHGCNFGTTGTCTGNTANLYLNGFGAFEVNCPYITISGTTVTMYQTDKTTPFNWPGIAQTATIRHDDTWAITQAIQTGKNVHISKGNYNVHLMQGATSPIFALNNIGQIIEGEGAGVSIGDTVTTSGASGSNIIDRDGTADVFKITVSDVLCRNFGYTYDNTDRAKTAGSAFNLTGPNTYPVYVSGAAIRDMCITRGYIGISVNGFVARSWFQNSQILYQSFAGILLNNPTPYGDLHFESLEMGAGSQVNAAGIYIKAADTNNFSNIKVNGSDPPLRIDSSGGNVFNQRFMNCSFENGGYGTFAYNIDISGNVTNCHFSNGEVGISGGGFYLNGAGVIGTVIEAVSLYLLGNNAVYVHGAGYTSIIANVINGNVQAVVCDNSASVIAIDGNTSTGSLSIDATCTRVGLGQGNKFAGGITAAPTASAGTVQTGSTDFFGRVTALSATACTITFRTGFNAVIPSITITPENAAVVSYALTAVSATAFTVTFSAAVSGFAWRVHSINE